MASKIDTIERDGRQIAVYDNGMERDIASGRIVKPAPKTLITAENSSALHRARQKKTARLLRQAIVAETADKLELPRTGPAEAVAAAGGILWREIVLDENAYHRDRLEAFEKLGRHAGVLADGKQQEPQRVEHVYSVDPATARLLAEIREARQARAVNGEPVQDDV